MGNWMHLFVLLRHELGRVHESMFYSRLYTIYWLLHFLIRKTIQWLFNDKEYAFMLKSINRLHFFSSAW